MKAQRLGRVIFLLTFLVALSCFHHCPFAIVLDNAVDESSLSQQNEEGSSYVPGEVLVKFNEGSDPDLALQNSEINYEDVNRVNSIKWPVSKFREPQIGPYK